ncbi:MAG: chemotaxis protein CheC [Cycloclasticus sp.]
MSNDTSILDEIHLDALGELLNIGMGAAAAALSTMVQQEVLLTVPIIRIVPSSEVASQLDDNPPNTVCGVKQSFSGEFSGDALLLFSEEKSLSLVRAVVGDSIPLEELSEMEEEAITEIGNIILNACISSLANIFNDYLDSALPEYLHEELELLFEEKESNANFVLLLRMSFNIAEQDITGYVTFIMDINSIIKVKAQINKMLGIAD